MKKSKRRRTNGVLTAAMLAVLGLGLGLGACTGDDGSDGNDGRNGLDGTAPGGALSNFVDSTDPLSSMVAGSLNNAGVTGIAAVDTSNTIPAYVRALVAAYDANQLPASMSFPLPNIAEDSVRMIPGLKQSIVVKWLDPLTNSNDGPRFGANCDYIAYFGEGWNNDWPADGTLGSAPQWNGSGESAWVWVNHEYISGSQPTTTSAPNSQQAIFAKFLRNRGVLGNDVTSNVWAQRDVDTLIDAHKRHIGGSWFRIVKDPYTLEWSVDRSAQNMRFDASSNTLLRVTGYQLSGVENDDLGRPLPSGIVVGLQNDCSGGQSPWGTIISCEENVQQYYGDLEDCWTSNQGFTHTNPTDAYAKGKVVSPNFSADTSVDFGQHSDARTHHRKDAYGFPAEIDVGEYPNFWYESAATGGDGRGHRKMGSFGRARWENAAFAIGPDWRLVDGQQIVIYAGDDRRGGRLFKWVSAEPYSSGMTRAQVRALLDTGELYVAQFDNLDNNTGDTINGGAVPNLTGTLGPQSGVGQGTGRWVLLGVNSSDIAPNAGAAIPTENTYVTDVGSATTTVGQALQDLDYNGIGGFNSDNLILSSLFTACAKIGVRELNRPEDVEWCPVNRVLYIAFTNHGRRSCVDDNGVLYDPATQSTASPVRADPVGSLFGLLESDRSNPADSRTFTFWRIIKGTQGQGVFDFANPDNLMLDKEGGLWFGTDGNAGTNGTGDAVYYVPMNAQGVGRAFRVAAGPSDSEFTGPCLSSDQRTLFGNIQHPGESATSTWPQNR